MRSVSSAICTSGDPVSLPERWWVFTTCAFCATCNPMLYLSASSVVFSCEPAILANAALDHKVFEVIQRLACSLGALDAGVRPPSARGLKLARCCKPRTGLRFLDTAAPDP